MARPEENHANLGIKPAPDAPKSMLQSLAEAAGKVASAVTETVKEVAKDTPMENWHLGSAHTKAFMANGLDELRQAFHPGVEQIQAGNAPGLYGTPTTGEATVERLGQMSLDDLRSVAAVKAVEASNNMENQNENGRSHGR